MAKADLIKLAEKATRFLEADTNYWRAHYNKRTHVYKVSVPNLIQQVRVQLGRKRYTPIQEEGMLRVCTEFAHNMYKVFEPGRSRGSTDVYEYKLFGNKNDFYVVIIGKEPFAQLSRVRTKHYSLLKNKLLNQVFKAKEDYVKPIMGAKDKEGRLRGGLFDIGHAEEYSVAEKRINLALQRFSLPSRLANLQQYAPQSKLTILAQEQGRFLKTFKIEVSDESSTANRGKRESEWIADTRRVLEKFVEDHADWANQAGSRSAVDIITAELLGAAKLKGAKVTATKKKSAPAKADSKIKGKLQRGKQEQQLVEVDALQQPVTNWNRLIPIINSKLTDTIISNMQLPGLQNRTGSFAASARVVGVEVTSQGFPSFVFDYERDPYDVFDRVKGKAPWNTPERNPATLVGNSVREIVSQLAIGRFYTRRL